jgi:hypothetical protein
LEQIRYKNDSADRLAQLGLLLTLVALCALTWRKWGYLPIDSGREMYVPAEIATGKRLYFDLWYPYGPLIPYWHAVLFRIFGIHLGVLIGAGVAVVSLITFLLYAVSRVFLPVALSFAAVFAFLLQVFQVDLFNYILPYSYAAAYGSMFSVLLLWLLLQSEDEMRTLHWIAAGFIASLMTLAKLEFGAAGYAALGCALAMRGLRTKSVWALLTPLCALLPGALLCFGIYGWYVRTAGADFFLGQNLSILPSSHFQQHFAAAWNEKTGLVLSPGAIGLSMFRGLAGFGMLSASIVLAARFNPGFKLVRWVLPTIALGLCLFSENREAVKILRLFFFNNGMIWAGLVVLALAWKDRTSGSWRAVLLCTLAMACGVRALTKMSPYGYAMFFDVLVYLMWLVGLCEVAKRFSVRLDGVFGGVLAAILCASVVALTLDYYPIRERSYVVSSERGLLYTSPEIGKGYSQALAFLESAKRNSERAVILPEDTSLYFLSGTSAPGRWYLVLPQVLPPGAATADYIEELARADPRYILVSDRATPEFGLPVFGVDYGQPILAWIGQHYRVVQQIGDYQPVEFPREWGALLYERRDL